MSFTILKPVTCPPRLKNLSVLSRDDLADLEWIFLERNPQEVMAIDFETKGDWGDPDSYPVGVSLSDSRGSLYIPFEQGTDTYEKVMRLLSQYQVPLIAHNVLFDGGWPLRDFGLWLNWKACTFAMYRLTATEGWPGQTWGLKSAQKDLLQWNETNEKKLDEWLVDNGYVSTASKEPKEGYVLRGTPGTEEARWLSPKKSEMWRAPVEILGHYACLDADACWLLYTYILKPAVDRYQVLSEYLFNMYPPFLRRLIEQKMYGIQIDIPKLTKYKEDLLNEIQTLQTHLLNSPEVKPHILQWNSLYIDEISRAEPPKYKKVRISPEPKRLTKSGKISGTWAKWDARRRDLEERGPELTLNWVKWQEKLEAAKKGQHFNLNSGKQLAWLLYERLQFPVEIRTDSGAPATDEDALLGMGEVGRMLIKLNELSKIVQFCDQTLELTRKDSSTIHPGFMAPGTLTGRLSGRNPNLQQVPKVGRFLECWVPRPGKVWVDCYAEDTEVLTKRGWVLFKDLEKQDLVYTVNEANEGYFTREWEYIEKPYSGDMYQVGQHLVTPNHKFFVHEGQRMMLAKDLPEALRLPSTSYMVSHSDYTEQEIWMACMLQADGSKHATQQNRYSLEFKRERKIAKAQELLNKESWVSGRGTSIFSYVPFESNLLDWNTKTLRLSTLGANQADTLYEAIKFWDGTAHSKSSVRYSSTVKQNVDEVSAYFSRAGYKCTVGVYYRKTKHVPCYRVDISKVTTRKVHVEKTKYNGTVYCVKAAGGYLMVRRHGEIVMGGNCDHSAIEPVVLTELSKDPGLWTIYGPTAEPNDVYLFVGANLPGIGEKIRATGYVPEAPTKEAIQRAKKECKKERQIAKTVKLAADYGAGPGKLQYTLKVQGIPISLKEAEEIHAAFWRLFSGIREWRMELEAQHKFNRGWVLNGIGRPLGVWEEAKKDLVNRVCQSTGHDFHLYYQQVVAELLDEEGVEWKPIIVDFHDQMIVEVSPGDAERTKYLMGVRAYEILNARMGGLIRIKGEANVVENLAYAKVENWGKGS